MVGLAAAVKSSVSLRHRDGKGLDRLNLVGLFLKKDWPYWSWGSVGLRGVGRLGCSIGWLCGVTRFRVVCRFRCEGRGRVGG